MYTLAEVIALKDKIALDPSIQYCNDLVTAVYKTIYDRDNSCDDERLLQEEWEEIKSSQSYHEYVIAEIEKELVSKNIAFLCLANSTGEDKTFIHEFVLFNTDKGVIRMDSYGQSSVFIEGVKHEGGILYQNMIVDWNHWKTDLKLLLTYPPGKTRLQIWNNAFTAKEIADTDFNIDVVLYQ